MSIHNQVFTVKSVLVGKKRYSFNDAQGKLVQGAKFYTLEQIHDENGNGEGQLTTEIRVPYVKYEEIPLGPIEMDMQLKAGGRGEVVLVDVRKGKATQ